MTAYRLTFRDWSDPSTAGGEARPIFIINRHGEYLTPVRVEFAEQLAGTLVGLRGDTDEGRDRLKQLCSVGLSDE
jgi:hypothetical protein